MTLLYATPALLNILGIAFILMFMYAVLGMELFAGVMWGEYLNADANFCSFPRALLTMFRCATGEDWNGIMHDVMVTPERGCSLEKSNCGSPFAVPFFVSYIILTSFVVLKMLIALIIENFKLSVREEHRLVRNTHRDEFIDAWAMLDPDGTGQLPVHLLSSLIRELPPPLGVEAPPSHGPPHAKPGETSRLVGRRASSHGKDISYIILSLDIRTYEPKEGGRVILFHELLLALTTRALNNQAKAEKLHDEVVDSHGRLHGTADLPLATLPSEAPEHAHGGKAPTRDSSRKSARTSAPSSPSHRSSSPPGKAPASSRVTVNSPSKGETSRWPKTNRTSVTIENVEGVDDLDQLRAQFLDKVMAEEPQLQRQVSYRPLLERQASSKASTSRASHAPGMRRDSDASDEDSGVEDRADDDHFGAPASSLMCSLQAEYAVTVIQEKWRAAKLYKAEVRRRADAIHRTRHAEKGDFLGAVDA